ncbi:hypothetical protein HGB07_08520, partial [Candidatus Roizmanbacteria bacterium]|nr:hypothetical protein [Candidatus Roizmanbacteria bacterium]
DVTVSSYDDKNAGTAKTVTVSGMTLVGTDAANYTINNIPWKYIYCDVANCWLRKPVPF